MRQELEESAAAIRDRCRRRPAIGLILGSGLGELAEELDDRTVIPFAEVPRFPRPGVVGHAGNLVIGELEGVPIAVLQGRAHLYEGYSAAQVAYPARTLACLGVRRLVVTAAAGALDDALRPGDLMRIVDHINLTGENPLAGPGVDEIGEPFADLSEAYDRSMRELAARIAAQQGMPLPEGVYVGVLGPSYETPAEVRMCRMLGGDAVGMSVVSEVIAARHMNVRVLGLACITNMAAGLVPQRLGHAEVIRAAAGVRRRLGILLRALVPALEVLDRESGSTR